MPACRAPRTRRCRQWARCWWRWSSAVGAVVHDVLGESGDADVAAALSEVQDRRARCVLGASRRARSALQHDESPEGDQLEGEWLSYAALLVQVDRIVRDLSSPLPT